MRVTSRVLGLLLGAILAAPVLAGDPIESEFLFETAPFRSCHASTIAETSDGLVSAWFGGSDEGNADVTIWLARRENGHWTKPIEVADGKQRDGQRRPCWNPVLYQAPGGPLLLFYKVGPSPSRWWGEMKESTDSGKTWSAAKRLPDGILGPIKNKPVRLADGTLLCPSSTEDKGWRVHFESTADLGRTWRASDPLGDGVKIAIIQPTVLIHPDGRLQALCRNRHGAIVQTESKDGGLTWGAPELTKLPNPNSGVDAVTLKDGRHLLIYNHTTEDRSPLNVAVSADGKTWKAGPVLETEPGEYSYPAVIQTRDGLVHITYTWKRKRIKHVTLDPAKLSLRDQPEPAAK